MVRAAPGAILNSVAAAVVVAEVEAITVVAAAVHPPRTTLMEAVAAEVAEVAHPISSRAPRSLTVGKAGKTRLVTAWLTSLGSKAMKIDNSCRYVLSIVAVAKNLDPHGRSSLPKRTVLTPDLHTSPRRFVLRRPAWRFET